MKGVLHDFATRLFLCIYKLVIFEFETITHVCAEGQQCNGNLGDNAGIFILYIGIVPPNINNFAVHDLLLRKTAPGNPGAVIFRD